MNLESASAIARELGLDQHGMKIQALSGTDTAKTFFLGTPSEPVFIKIRPLSRGALLSAEADGLQALADTGVVRVPRVIGRGMLEDEAWLALEWLELSALDERGDAALGEQIGLLHRHTADQFGWHRNNHIGTTPQINQQRSSWTDFFIDQRIAYQLKRLEHRQPDTRWQQYLKPLVEAWTAVSQDHDPAPSLIHGDLWVGNAGRIQGQTPVIFDPATHYADRECDLAMAALFGGFHDEFFAAYNRIWPLREDHLLRRPFYQLYHLLNHANMFGSQYIATARRMIERLIA